MEGLDGLLLRNLPGGALAALVVIAVLAVWRGWLVPRGTLDRLDAAVSRVDAVQAQRLRDSIEREAEWKAAYMASEEARRLQAGQIGDLLELARTTDTFIRTVVSVTSRNTG